MTERPPATEIRSSEQLGFPPDARLLIINADDLGMSEAINVAIIGAIEEGIASSCSLMAPCPAAEHAVDLLRRRRGMPFGIHLTLVCDSTRTPWGPLSAREEVPSLLTGTGALFGPDRVPDLLARARIEDVEREFRAQIRAVLDAGLSPTHLDWHCLADGGRDDVFDLAEEHGLAVRAWSARGRRELRRRGSPVTEHPFLDSFALDVDDDKTPRFAEMLRGVPAGLSEWAVHPGLDDAGSRAADDGWRVRATDHEFLTSPAARAIVRDEGIVVLDHRAVQRAWLRRRRPPQRS